MGLHGFNGLIKPLCSGGTEQVRPTTIKEESQVAATKKRDRKPRQPKKNMDEVVRYALSHQVRVEILIALNEGLFTANMLAERTDQNPSTIGNHLQRMLEEGAIEVGKEEQKNNITQYWYRAVQIPVYSKEAAEAMTPMERQVTVGAIAQSGIAEVLAALNAKTLADPSSILYWSWFCLDAQGCEEADSATHDYLERLREIEATSTNRRAISKEAGRSMLGKVAFFRRARPVRKRG